MYVRTRYYFNYFQLTQNVTLANIDSPSIDMSTVHEFVSVKSSAPHNYDVKTHRISSYKALPWIIPAILTILCSMVNVVLSTKTCIWRLCKIIISAGLIWGNTIFSADSQCWVFKQLYVIFWINWRKKWVGLIKKK